MEAATDAAATFEHLQQQSTNPGFFSIHVAYLYGSTETPVRKHTATNYTDGSPLPPLVWKADVVIDLKYCPVSGEKVAMVCDGGVVARAEAEVAAAEEQEEGDNSQHTTKAQSQNKIVLFRYGTKTYQLSTNVWEQPKEQQPQSTTPSSFWWWWSWFGACGERAASVNTNDGRKENRVQQLAQDRIAEALDLTQGLKILHKGKLLCDYNYETGSLSSPFGGRAQITADESELSVLSHKLLQISEDDWKTASNKKKKKATLVVMGTPSRQRMKEIPDKDADTSTTGMRSIGNGGRIFWRTLSTPVNLLWWSFRLSWQLVVSFFGPFLPDSWTIDPSQHRLHND